MPIYEYECTSCHHQFESLQKVNADPITICPKCSQETVKRLFSAAGFQLKGTGWYATDFKNPPKKEKETPKTDAAQATEVSAKADNKNASSKETVTKKETQGDKA